MLVIVWLYAHAVSVIIHKKIKVKKQSECKQLMARVPIQLL